MKAELALGLRLAGLTPGTRWSTRWRSVSVFTAGLIGSVLLLALAAITASEISQRPLGFVEDGVKVLLVTVVITVVTPVLTLAATTARLAAATRDRQLANLRLLGLSGRRTRLVAASEVAVAAGLGAAAGAAVFVAARPLLAALHPAGRQWPVDTLVPHWYAAIAAVLLVPVAVVVVAIVPARGRGRDALRTSRHGTARRPHPGRLAPLVLGLALATFVLAQANSNEDDGLNSWLAPYLFGAMALLAVGTVLTVPWLVRVLADALVRVSTRPSSRIAGRRLQAQPAAVTRIVAGLLIGLFIVTGARAVVVAFEDTQQYRSAALTETIGQVGTVTVARRSADKVIAQLRSRPDVAAVGRVTVLEASSDTGADYYFRAYVGTCADLLTAVPTVRGCRDGVLTRLQPGDEARTPLPPGAAWRAQSDAKASIQLPDPAGAIDDVGGVYGNAGLDAMLLVPPDLPGVPRLIQTADVELLIRARPGTPIGPLFDEVLIGQTPPPWFRGGSYPSSDYYGFVSGLRALVWAIALLVLAVGLLTFMFSGADRALGRHREATALQLVGVPPRLLRRSQFIEAVVPTGLGAALAVGLGLLAGSSFLAYGGILELAPLGQTLLLLAGAVAGTVLVAGVLAGFASPRIRAENIRTE